MNAYIETSYELYGNEVRNWKNADTVIFLVWCAPEKKKRGIKKEKSALQTFSKSTRKPYPQDTTALLLMAKV